MSALLGWSMAVTFITAYKDNYASPPTRRSYEKMLAAMEQAREAILANASDSCECCGVSLLENDTPVLCEICHGSFEHYDDGAYCANHQPDEEK